MIYLKEEFGKIVSQKILYVFLAFCMFFNAGLIFSTFSQSRELKLHYEDYVQQAGENLYADLDVGDLGILYYDKRYEQSDILVRLMHQKYEKLEESVEQLAEENAGASTYAGDLTSYVNSALFEYLMKAIMLEGMLFISLVVLTIFGMEYRNQTAPLVYCSRRGRTIAIDKMIAALAIGVAGLAVLSAVSYFLFFLIWDFRDIWGANISSSFHFIMDNDDPIFNKPFITWRSFTVKQYFAASVLCMTGIWIFWWMLSTFFAFLCRRILVAAGWLTGFLILPCAGLLLLKHSSVLYFLCTLSIADDILYSDMWFTDLGYHAVLPWQETISIGCHLILGLLLVLGGYRQFCRKDIR